MITWLQITKAIPRERLPNILDREAWGTGQAIEKESRQSRLHTFGAKGISGGVVKCVEIGKNTK